MNINAIACFATSYKGRPLRHLKDGIVCMQHSSYDRTGGNDDGLSGTFTHLRRAAARYFGKKLGRVAAGYGQKLAEQFGKKPIRCPECGSTKMLLVRIWSKTAGVLYDLLRDWAKVSPALKASGQTVTGVGQEQLAFAI